MHLIKHIKSVEFSELDTFVGSIIWTDRSIVISFLNQHGFNLASKSSVIADAFCSADYILRDGKGIELGCRLNGVNPGHNMNGTDFIPLLINKILDSRRECDFFAFGTKAPWLNDGAGRLFQNSSYVSLDGFKDVHEYVETFRERQCEKKLSIVVLAMGMPKQELLAVELKLASVGPSVIICGGAILDFCAGKVPRAPALLRRYGFEWFFRLIWEPRRLFSRYVIGIPLFFLNLFRYSS